MEILLAVLGASLLFMLEQVLYRRYWNKHLTVGLSFSDEKAVEGEELLLYETVVNKKLLPLPILKVKFTTSKYLSFAETNNSTVTDNTYRNDLLSVLMYQKLTRSLSFLCSHRGYYTISSMDVVCCDLFLSYQTVANYPLDIHLYVYPKFVESQQFQAYFRNMLGTVLTKRFINEDPFEFRSIREYQSYDTLKSVNWKASAKTDSLKVNVHDYTASQQIKILLNLDSETNWIHEDILEESIRIAATFASAFINQGIPTAVYTNAPDSITTNAILHVPAGSGSNHMRALLETLSRIDLTRELPAFVPTVEEEALRTSRNDYILVISSYQKEDLQNLLSSLHHAKSEFSWIVPFKEENKLSVSEELMPFVIPWELYAS